jgi:endo-1,4-beta-xylanase
MKKRYLFISFGILLSLTFGLLITMVLNRNTKAPLQKQAVLEAQSTILEGQWQYMPGVTKTNTGLLVKPMQFSFVEQNGVTGDPNPPINLAGTHLENVKGDFVVTGNVSLQTATKATIQLYGQVPIIADEFRKERESIRLDFEKTKLTVSIWNGSRQTPVKTVSYAFADKQPLAFSVTRQKNMLNISVNNQQLGSVNEYNIFKSGKVLFGLDGQGGEWLLSGLQATATNGGTLTVKDSSSIQVATHDANGLQAKANKKRPGFLVGTTIALGPMTTDPDYAKLALDNQMFGSITPENDMKMSNVEPQQGVFSFQKADSLVKFAKQNGQKIHGHTLVFGEANPPWFNQLPVATVADKQKIEQIMLNHVTTVVKHFGADIMSWDVINEPLADYDDMDRGAILRNHKWYQAMGEDYIVKAMTAAHTANPDAILFINDYGLEEDGYRWNTMISLLTRLKPKLLAAGIPADKLGVGFQAHVYEAGDKINPLVLRKHIQQLAKLGYKAQISENDVYSDDGTAIQASQYRDIFNACLNEPNCIRWNTWIMSDRYNVFKDDDGQIYNGEDGLFGSDMKPRPGFTAIQNLLQ